MRRNDIAKGGGRNAWHCFDSSGFTPLSSSFSISPRAGRCDDDILNRGSSSHVHLLIIKSLDERKEKRESVLINYLNNHSYRPRSTPTCPHYLAEENLENFLSLLPPFLPSPRWITRQAPASFFSPLFIALHNFRFLRDK